MVELVGGMAHEAVAMPYEASLVHWDGHGAEQRWPLATAAGTLLVGRSAAADVCIPWDPQVSRLHATLQCVGGHWTLTDDGLSRNGTFVNGVRVSHRVRLHDRDRIRFGSTVLTFCALPQTGGQRTLAGLALPAALRLTGPQRSVLAALCRPYRFGRPHAAPASNAEIAAELCLTVDAVKTHLRVLFSKFGIEDLPQNQKRARLAELTLELGLAPDGDS